MNTLPVNKHAGFDFELLGRFQAGVALRGFEAKSIQLGRGNIAGAFVILRGGEAWLVNADIPPYQSKNTPAGYDPARARKLLLTRRELDELVGKTAHKGLTLVPIRFYAKGPRVKLEFALARRKKGRDKRETIRMRESKRAIERALKRSDE